MASRRPSPCRLEQRDVRDAFRRGLHTPCREDKRWIRHQWTLSYLLWQKSHGEAILSWLGPTVRRWSRLAITTSPTRTTQGMATYGKTAVANPMTPDPTIRVLATESATHPHFGYCKHTIVHVSSGFFWTRLLHNCVSRLEQAPVSTDERIAMTLFKHSFVSKSSSTGPYRQTFYPHERAHRGARNRRLSVTKVNRLGVRPPSRRLKMARERNLVSLV